MKDRFSNGFAAGFLAGFAPLVINLSGRALNLTEILWSDFMALFTFGQMTKAGLPQTIFAITMEFILFGILGGIFGRYILPSITSQRQLFKGALFGATAWMVFFSIPYLLQLPQLQEKPLGTTIFNAISSTIWGLTMAFILKRIDNRVKQ